MRYFTATLAANETVGPHLFVLALDGCEALADARPGQFVMMRGAWGRDPLLPRAFSILGVQPGGRAEFLVKAVGRGTGLLEAARPGARIDILGPLGTAFPAPDAGRADWLVAGGVGLAPLLLHAETAARAGLGSRVRLFYGGRRRADLALADRIAATGAATDLVTEDGSAGAAGLVTDAVVAALDATGETPVVMACGPDPMLRAVARLARRRALTAWLSLEGEMACGLGACLGCAVPHAAGGWRYTCKHGPVMSLAELGGRYAEDTP